jgi:hypothetical protein
VTAGEDQSQPVIGHRSHLRWPGVGVQQGRLRVAAARGRVLCALGLDREPRTLTA